MYLSFTANRKQFINALFRATSINSDVRDTAFSTFTFRTNERFQSRKVYPIGHIGFTLFAEDFTWQVMLVCPSTQPVSTCRIIFNGGNTTNYVNISLSDTVPEEDYPDVNVFSFILAKMSDFSTEEYPIGGHALMQDLFLHEVDARKAVGMQWHSITPMMLNHKNHETRVLCLYNNYKLFVVHATNNAQRHDTYVIQVSSSSYFRSLLDRGSHGKFLSETLSVDAQGVPVHPHMLAVTKIESELTQAICVLIPDDLYDVPSVEVGGSYPLIEINESFDNREFVKIVVNGNEVAYPKHWFYIFCGKTNDEG